MGVEVDTAQATSTNAIDRPAYRSHRTSSRRQQLNVERLAELAGKSAFEDDEAVGHLEQAHHYLAQLAGEDLPVLPPWSGRWAA